MTTNRFSKPKIKHQKSLVAIAVIVFFAVAAIFLTRPQTVPTSLSAVSGLVALKASAQTAISYDLAMANHKPTLIEFYADWCTTCQALAPTLQAVHQQFAADLNLVMLNIDDPQWRSQIQQFRINGVPHLVLLNTDQTIAGTFVGEIPRQILSDRITNLLDAASAKLM